MKIILETATGLVIYAGENLVLTDDGATNGDWLHAACTPPIVNPDNPHSSEFYRAIQFTSRQLIKLKNPLYEDVRELKALVRHKGAPEDLAKTIDRIDLKYLQREIRFFYPFEVQLVDVKSAEENEKGRSAHSEYKKAQIQTALKRVMGSFIETMDGREGEAAGRPLRRRASRR